MEITHGIALFFVTLFMVLGMFYRTMLWWLVSVGTVFAISFVALLNGWELIFFIPMTLFGMISVIGFIYSAVRGDWL